MDPMGLLKIIFQSRVTGVTGVNSHIETHKFGSKFGSKGRHWSHQPHLSRLGRYVFHVWRPSVLLWKNVFLKQVAIELCWTAWTFTYHFTMNCKVDIPLPWIWGKSSGPKTNTPQKQRHLCAVKLFFFLEVELFSEHNFQVPAVCFEECI